MKAKPFGLSTKAIVQDRGRVLLLQRSQRARFFRRQWDLPGGGVNSGEDFLTGLHREVAEETGLRISITGLVGALEHELPELRVVLLVFAARRIAGRVETSEEHERFAWVAPTEMLKMNLSTQVRPVLEEFARMKSGRRLTRRRAQGRK